MYLKWTLYLLGLINKLWEESFTPAQLKGGFRACGLFPVNRDAIAPFKLATSVPFTVGTSTCTGGTAPETATATTTTKAIDTGTAKAIDTGTAKAIDRGSAKAIDTGTARAIDTGNAKATVKPTAKATTVLDLKCKDCGSTMTPIRMHVVAYFTQHLQKEIQQRPKDKRRLKPRYYGEALTRDEIIERMEEEEQEKKKKKKGKGKKAKQIPDDANADNSDAESDGKLESYVDI